MQNIISKRETKGIYNSSECRPLKVPCIHSKQDWFGPLPYHFSNEILDTIQQVYSEENRYVSSTIQTIEGIKAIVHVDSLLGIKKEMSYVPASTISAIVSQCSALVLWAVLRGNTEDPTDIYNRLVENELVGFIREHAVYNKRIPLRTKIPVYIRIMRVVRRNGNLFVQEKIDLGNYMHTEILGYAFLSKI